MKLEEYPPEFQTMINEMAPAAQVAALTDLTFSDFARLANLRLREALATYGPNPFLGNAGSRLQEAVMWAASFNPKTDAAIPPPDVAGIVLPTDEETKEVQRRRRGK